MDSSAEQKKSLYRELTISLTALVALVAISANLLNYAYASREAEVQYQHRLAEYAGYLRESLELPLWNIDDELIGKVSGAFVSNADVALLTVRDDRQRVIYHLEKSGGYQLTRRIPVAHNGQNIGSVELGLTLQEVVAMEQRLLLASAANIILLFVVLLFAMRLTLSRLLKQPIEMLVGAIGGVVEGKYRQLGLTETYVEFAPILSGFRVMTDAVASRESSLYQANETLAAEVTERKLAEKALHELKDELEVRVNERTAQLESANKELEAFSYSVSHDLRTPLRAIDGFSRILLDDYNDKLDDEGRRLLKVVRDNTSRMGQLIDDILKFSRTGRVEINFSRIDMERLAREVCAELQAAAAEANLQVEIAALPPATGDSAMMRQVFVNLVSNAIKFSRQREAPRVKVGGGIEGQEAVYYVRDNGAGFDMQYADKLFGVFQRLHGVNEFEGTGIGLAIVKRIVTRHGGRVWAEGKVGEGATIYFALPNGEERP